MHVVYSPPRFHHPSESRRPRARRVVRGLESHRSARPARPLAVAHRLLLREYQSLEIVANATHRQLDAAFALSQLPGSIVQNPSSVVRGTCRRSAVEPRVLAISSTGVHCPVSCLAQHRLECHRPRGRIRGDCYRSLRTHTDHCVQESTPMTRLCDVGG